METQRIVWNTRSLKSWPETNTKLRNEKLSDKPEKLLAVLCRCPQKTSITWRSKHFSISQDRLEGQMNDRERRVTHLIASEAQEAFYADREIICYKQRANTLSRWREEIRVLKEPDALGHAVASCEISGKLCTNKRYSKSRLSKT